MTLMNAPVYDAGKAKRMKYALIGAGVLVALLVVATFAGFISGHGWLFSNLYTEHRVNKFLTAIEQKDFATAYGIYQNDADWLRFAVSATLWPAADSPDQGGNAADDGGETNKKRGIENKHVSDSEPTHCSLFVLILQ